MGRASSKKLSARKEAALVGKLSTVMSAFGKLTRKEQRQFANAVSDQMPTNEKLGNSSRQSRGADQRPPTSQAGKPSQDGDDYFRRPRNAMGEFKDQPDASITPARVTQSVRQRTNAIRGLTFERLVAALDQLRLGFFRAAGMAWDTMERRDYQLQIVRPKRLKSVARHGYDVLIRDDVQDSQKALAQQQKDFLNNFYNNATATTAINPDEEGGFSLLVRQMMDAVGKYYAVHEIVWQPMPDGTLTAKFIFCPMWWFEGTRGKLRFLPSEFQIYGNDMPPGEWVVTCGDGIMEACSVVYLMKAMLLKANLSFLDKFGQPGIHGETDAQKGTPEWDAFVSAVQDFGQEWATVTNRGAKISLIETQGGAGADGYEKLLQVFDRAMTQLWRGGDLGTSSGKNATGASLQQDESEILETDDAKMIEETLTLKVSRFALAWKFGPDTPQLAYIKLKTTPRRNIQDDLAVDAFLSALRDSKGKGLLGTQTLLERYSRPLPKPGDDTVQTAPQVAAPGQKGKQVPPGEADQNPEFGNADVQDVGATIHDMLLPILDSLDAVRKIDDPALQRRAAEALLRNFPHLETIILHNKSLAKKLLPELIGALLSGLKNENENQN